MVKRSRYFTRMAKFTSVLSEYCHGKTGGFFTSAWLPKIQPLQKQIVSKETLIAWAAVAPPAEGCGESYP